MFIVSKDRDMLINMDNVTNIYIENRSRIMARTVDSEEIVLGVYSNRADEIFSEVLDTMFIPNMVVTNKTIPDGFAEQFKGLDNKSWGIAVAEGENVVPYAREIYYMPEE